MIEGAPLPLDGGCECGATRYRIDGAPRSLHLCHCRECQRQSGSAFGMSLVVPIAALAFTAAAPARWLRTGQSGRTSDCRFCATCGSRLANLRPDAGVAAVKAGTLDDVRWLNPARDYWLAEAQGWPMEDHGRERLAEGPGSPPWDQRGWNQRAGDQRALAPAPPSIPCQPPPSAL